MSDLFIHQINNNAYRFVVMLMTVDGKYHQLNPAAIKSLVIEDCLYNFYHKGHIIIDNSYDLLERPFDPNNVADTFLFMGDSRDVIAINIAPLDASNSISDDAARVAEINLLAIIYDSEEIYTGQPNEKYRKLYFHDVYYELLKEKNTYWSTAQVVKTELSNLNLTQAANGPTAEVTSLTTNLADFNTINIAGYTSITNVNNLSNEDRGIPTGQAIKEFLAAALPQTDSYHALFPGPTFNNDGNNTTNLPTLNSGIDIYWDIGSTNIFFSTPSKFKAIDSLNYLLDRHVSTADNWYDQSVLRIDRYSRCFTLIPLTTIFGYAYDSSNNAGGPRYVETVRLGAIIPTDSANTVYSYTPQKNVFNLTQSGAIRTFGLEPTIGKLTQPGFNTKFVHSYDSLNKQFQIDSYYNNISSVVSTYFDNYVWPIKNTAYSNLIPGKYRVENKNVDHVFTIIERDPLQRVSQGRNKSLYAAIYANNQVTFTAPGFTARQAGYFIGIDRDASTPSSPFDQKFLGIYLMTEVKHIFQNNAYTNEIKAIKTYTENQLYQGQTGSSIKTSIISNQTTI